MAIQEIDEDKFHSYNVVANATFVAEEVQWFEDKTNNLLATILQDRFDHDWSFVILAKEEDGEYRAIDLAVSMETQGAAEIILMDRLSKMAVTGEFVEELYTKDIEIEKPQQIIITDISEEVKKYFKKYPEKLYELHPRKFEELVASILKDMGLDVELTPATKDGGYDIIAHIKHELASLMILVECKRFTPSHKVDVGIVRQVAGVHDLHAASKSIIVTTNRFTKDAIELAKEYKGKIELKDYDNLKEWLKRY